MQFDIPLAEQKVKPHQVTALHLLVAFALLAASAIALLINNEMVILPGNGSVTNPQNFDVMDTAATAIMLFSITTLLAGLFRNRWLRSSTVNKTFRITELICVVTVAIYLLVIEFHILAVLFGILAATIVFSFFWESGKNARSLHVSVDDSNIKLPITSRRRTINWAETEKVMLRHGTLTISCINNRMYQWMTAINDVDREIFEAYCDAQIEAAKKNRKKYDW